MVLISLSLNTKQHIRTFVVPCTGRIVCTSVIFKIQTVMKQFKGVLLQGFTFKHTESRYSFIFFWTIQNSVKIHCDLFKKDGF